ncbi:MAG TPA: DNA polymerase III subunit gamma/tau [Roseiflexaceae bacterium]|nr:DNA polymerase III subunit gamma/tau [Roseiflexaceae bacterium]
MASQALYRRYRSQTFSELIGQEHIVQTLRNALAEGRLAHAYLFTGPRGVGKTSVARLLAKAVNCTADGERPCGECAMCVAVAEGSAVDVIEMDAASHTSVEDAREIIERVQFRPTQGTYKVYIIDEVHMLSTAAFNALLKTLEEPPGHALFILATTEVHKIPATILSRCQRFNFSRHTVAATAEHLHEIAAQEGFTLEAGVAESLARAATGSMRDALSLMDQLMAYGGNTITIGQVQNLLGATEAQEVTALIDALIRADVAEGLRAVAGVAAQGADLRQFARDVVERLRSLMLLKAGGDPALLDATEDELAVLHEQARAGDVADFLAWVRLFSGLDVQLRSSAIPQLPLEMAVVEALTMPTRDEGRRTKDDQKQAAELRRPSPRSSAPATPARAPAPPSNGHAATPPVEQVPARRVAETPASPPVEHAPPAEETKPAPVEIAPPAEMINDDLSVPAAAATQHNDEDASAIAAANADVAVFEQVENAWPDVVRDVRVENKMVQALLNSGVRPVDVQGDVVVLEVDSEFLMSRLDQPKSRAIIETILSKWMGQPYRIQCVVKAQQRDNPHTLREQVRQIRKDKLIRAALNIFDADIVAVERDDQGE